MRCGYHQIQPQSYKPCECTPSPSSMGCPNCHPSPLSNCATVPMTHKYQYRSTGTVWAFHIVHSRYNGAVASTDERQVWTFTHYRSTCTVYAIPVVRSRYIGECAKYRWILPSPYKYWEIYHWSHQWSTSHRVGWNLEINGVIGMTLDWTLLITFQGWKRWG